MVAAWCDWLAHEKRQAALTVKAYRTDLLGFLAFCCDHLGGPPGLDQLVALPAADLRAWLAWRHRQGLARTSTARALAALRSFYRYLDRQHGRHNAALKALRTPRLAKRLPRPLSSGQARGADRGGARRSRRPTGSRGAIWRSCCCSTAPASESARRSRSSAARSGASRPGSRS